MARPTISEKVRDRYFRASTTWDIQRFYGRHRDTIRVDGPPRMVKRPTGSGGEPSSPNCGASAGVRLVNFPLPLFSLLAPLGHAGRDAFMSSSKALYHPPPACTGQAPWMDCGPGGLFSGMVRPGSIRDLPLSAVSSSPGSCASKPARGLPVSTTVFNPRAGVTGWAVNPGGYALGLRVDVSAPRGTALTGALPGLSNPSVDLGVRWRIGVGFTFAERGRLVPSGDSERASGL